jgi:hypothetical protein
MRIQQRGATERKEVSIGATEHRSIGATSPRGQEAAVVEQYRHFGATKVDAHHAVSTAVDAMGTGDERRRRVMDERRRVMTQPRTRVISPATPDKKRMRVGGSPKLANSSDPASFFDDPASFFAPSPPKYTGGAETWGTGWVYSDRTDDSGGPAAFGTAAADAAGDASDIARYSTGNAWS